MTVIKQEDFIASVAGALQYISYYHPTDYITSLARAYEREQSPAAKDAIAQILINSRMCAEGHRPICQDTGVVNAFVKVELVRGDTVEITVAAKGGGSEAKSKFAMLNPSDSIVEWVLKTVPTMGAGWCPPGMIGIGIGGRAEKAMLLAKESLMDPIDIQELIERGPKTTAERLRVELYDKVNRLGIGAQGLGGLTTVLDVKVVDTPAQAANLPGARITNCAA